MQSFMGIDGFIWFTGVVEDRDDPSKLGRVRVRCVGHHTDDKSKIQTADLPWAHIMHPVTDPSMNGMGQTPSFMVEGTWVVGFFMDAEDKQQPVIIGTLPGVPVDSPDKSKGFNDPNGVYPKSNFLKESDVNRLARGVSEDTIVNTKTAALIENMPIANGEEWSEPKTTYGAEYPKNHVFESESGHIIELDDTSGAERLHEYSSSGTFYEIDKDGNRQSKVINNNKDIVRGDDFKFVEGDANISVSGTLNIRCKNFNIEVEEDYIDEIDGDRISFIKGGKFLDLTGALTENYGSTITRSVSGITTNNHDANVNNFIDGDFEVHTSAAVDIFAKTTVNIDTASFDVDASTVAAITSATTTINGSTASNIRGATVSIDGATVNIDTASYNLKATSSNLVNILAGGVVPHATDPDVTSPGSASVTDPTDPTITEPTEPEILTSSPSSATVGGGVEEQPVDVKTGQRFPSTTIDEDGNSVDTGGPFAGSNAPGQKKHIDNAGDLDPPTSTACTRKDLGKVSAIEESGGKGPAALGYDSSGGYSYGTYQIAASTGSMDSFMNFLNNEKNGYKDFYSQLGGASAVADSKSSANTQNVKSKDYGPFQKRWLNLAESSDQTTKDRFAQAQHDWTQRTHYDPAVNAIKESTGIDFCDGFHSAGVQDAIWSTAVQHGADGANTVFKRALERTGKTKDTVTDEELINAIYDERSKPYTGNDPRYIGSPTHYFKKAWADNNKFGNNIVTKRFPREKLKALALNTNTEFNVTSIGP